MHLSCRHVSLAERNLVNIMKQVILRTILVLFCCIPSLSFAATTTHTIHAAWSAYTAPSGYTLTGFKLYQEGVQACQTTNTAATSLDCTVSLSTDSTSFTLTATFSNGTESSHSTPFAFIRPSTIPLVAAFTASTTSGTVPFNVSFNASTSTGTISAYQWDFGDGSTGSGSTVNHTYSVSGSYTAKLTVIDSSSQTSTKSMTITANASTTTTPPTAVISSSNAAGQAPLTVSFNGSGSTAASGASIKTYSWNFGDSSTATGVTASHAFTTAGTYTTTLTVTDSNGRTASASTPVVVTTPAVSNKTPTAKMTVTPGTGTAPLAVAFDASGSSDSDGTIASYLWTFGDGSTATGKTASHTFTSASAYTVTLKVTDNLGASGTASTTVTALAAQQTPSSVKIEAGEVEIDHNWVFVPFESTFTNPVVIANMTSYNGNQACTVRIRNVKSTGFEIKIAEWDYLDVAHKLETVHYVVMEKGRTVLPDGSAVEAGVISGSAGFKSYKFSQSFSKAPVILTAVVSNNQAEIIGGRIKNVNLTGFDYYFREQESLSVANHAHKDESVHYVAWEPGKGVADSISYEVANVTGGVKHSWASTTFQAAQSEAPVLLLGMQTTNGTDTSSLRVQNLTGSGFKAMVEEEQSYDSETTHCDETVGYLAIRSTSQANSQTSYTLWPSTSTPATIDAGYDDAQELGVKFRSDVNGYITGIRFYKAITNTGTHVANLWTATGTLLATATFTNETASGWQEVQFAQPVAITANTVYVASYFCPDGHQSVDRDYFDTKGMDSEPLHALASGVSGGNGVYTYGSSSVFPTSTYRNTHYWVDVVFQQ